MRKTSRIVADAFLKGTQKKDKNNETDGTTLWYHGNRIAFKSGPFIYITLAGWNTSTTRERLNTLLDRMDAPITYGFRTELGQAYFHGDQRVRSTDWIRIQNSSPFLYEIIGDLNNDKHYSRVG